MIDTNNIEQAKNQIKKSSERPIIVRAKDDVFNRKILEYGKFDILQGLELSNKKDNLRSINSGLNKVYAKIASKNKISIGFDIEEIKKLNKKQKAEALAKMIQNIKIARKNKCKIMIGNNRHSQDLLLSLGASTAQAKEAIS